MDKKDVEILEIMQKDASVAVQELAAAVNLSSTPCWRRVQKLKDDGVIRQQVAICDPLKVNLGLTAFVSVKTSVHSEEWTRKFITGARDMPEIIEIYRVSGDVDYLMKVMVPDIAGFDRLYKKLVKVVDLQDVSSSFAMETIKCTTALPLDYVKQA